MLTQKTSLSQKQRFNLYRFICISLNQDHGNECSQREKNLCVDFHAKTPAKHHKQDSLPIALKLLHKRVNLMKSKVQPLDKHALEGLYFHHIGNVSHLCATGNPR